jgi:hypothetical protein
MYCSILLIVLWILTYELLTHVITCVRLKTYPKYKGHVINLGTYYKEHSVNLPLLTINTPFVRFDTFTSRMEANTLTIKPPHLL